MLSKSQITTAVGIIAAIFVAVQQYLPSEQKASTHPATQSTAQSQSSRPNLAPTPKVERVAKPANLPDTPDSFSGAKRLLYAEVYKGHQTTFYCGCEYNDDRQVDFEKCGYKPRKNARRAARIEAEHIVPAYWMGYTLQCWREPICTDNDGDKFKGRKCCEEINPAFETAHNDLHNLTPAVGEANGDRSNFRFGMLEGEPREYGACDFEVDSKQRRAEPPEAVRGDIARVSFYMEKTYGVKLSPAQRKLFEAWNRMDPVDAWELERNARIKKIQGNGNPFVEQAAE